MKKLIHSANSRGLAIVLAFVCLGLLPEIGAVVPPPDGGYPNFTTAEGTNALKNLTSGAGNTGIGWFSLFGDTTAGFNTAVGVGTLLFNNGDENTAIGAATLLFNTASGNTAVGSRALVNNTTGGTLENIAGLDVGPNVAVGWQALESNTVAGANTAVGYQALHSFATGPVGFEQLGLCTAVGFQALANATGGDGWANNAFGYQALMNNADGYFNMAVGFQALFSNSSGGSNTAIGNSALFANDTGNSNTAVGGGALSGNISGSNNIALGVGAGDGITTASNVICIGLTGQNFSDTTWIDNIYGVTTVAGNTLPVIVSSTGQLGTAPSSARFKKEVRPMDGSSESILALKPVTFQYKNDKTNTPQFGLIAEEVAKVNPDLVARDKNGEIYSVRYDQVNAMLLNEFLKEHKAFLEERRKVQEQDGRIQEQEATIAQLKTEVEAVVAHAKEQDSKIQKVSAQIEMSKQATNVVLNNR